MSTPTAPTVDAAPRRIPPLLYPTLLIAGIAVTVASVIGIAAMTGLLPQAQSQPVPALPAGGPAAGERPATKTVTIKPATSRSPASIVAAARCSDCGVVEAVHAIEVKGQASGVGAVAGGVVGGLLGNQVGGGKGRTAMTVVGLGAGAYAGNEVEKNMNKRVTYEVHVRMDDNTVRTFPAQQRGEYGIGQRVRIRDGRPVAEG